ncbi:hypothetical protein V1517DRAFT_317431 [Lipomyces orientalis]|uniref:Uncharacterized protein n=1 Tax=Lipomyces orientalis TaxID=1233043 RepID=A0ACC3TT88_9ASCO
MASNHSSSSIPDLSLLAELELLPKSSFTEVVGQCASKTAASTDQLLDLAVSSLNAFLQQNYTGPPLSFDAYSIFREAVDDKEAFAANCIAELETDSEEAYRHAEVPHLLILALAILNYLASTAPRKAVCKWLARALMVHQSLLSAPASTLHDQIFANLAASAPSTASASAFETAEHFLELARASIYYSYDSRAAQALKYAQDATGLEYKVTGIKALRTKYQQREIANLVVLARSSPGRFEVKKQVVVNDNQESVLPSALPLNSDLLLEAPKFVNLGETLSEDEESDKGNGDEAISGSLSEEDPNTPSVLADIDSCLLLVTEHRIRSVSPSNSPLTAEEVLAYVSRVILSSTSISESSYIPGKVNWTVFSRALWERSILESNSAKTVERGTLQMASLVDELGVASASTAMIHTSAAVAPVEERLKYLHVLPLLPRWRMDLALATQYLSLGMLRSAQDIYARLDLPIENALCTAAAGSPNEAIDILEKFLQTPHADNPRAWSVLGDITQKPEYWERAWDEGKYAAAKRSLGEYYFKAGAPDQCIVHLAEALKKNPLNRQAWFLYGCAGLETQQYSLAAEGFTRCVSMDKDDAKAWSNLATALLHMGQQPGAERLKSKEALSALAEACRLNPDDSRLWSNLVIVGAKLENWVACLRGTLRLVELLGDKEGEAALDLGVMRVLVQALVSDAYSSGENGAGSERQSFFERQAIKLFTETVPGIVTRTPELWLLTAKVEQWRNRPWAALDAYEKMFRLAVAAFESDETSKTKWTAAVDACAMVVDAYANLGELPGRMAGGDESQVVCKDWKWRAKTTVRSLMSKGKRLWVDSEGWDKLVDMRDDLK